MSVKIAVDSASDINIEEAKKLGVELIPLVIGFGDDEYLDGVELLPEQFYEKLIESDVLPKTSQINPYRFEEFFSELTADGSEVVMITLSSKLSGTYLAAAQAAEKFGGRVFAVDSLNACIGERLLCQLALRLKEQGLGGKEISDRLNEEKKNIRLMAMLNTLEYLKKGGRISSAVAFAGELLAIKPVVAVEDGEVKLIGKAMGSKKANNLLTTLVERSGGIDFDMPYGVVWSGNNDFALKKYVADSYRLWGGSTAEVPAYIVGSTIGTHVGPGAIGVAFFSKNKQ